MSSENDLFFQCLSTLNKSIKEVKQFISTTFKSSIIIRGKYAENVNPNTILRYSNLKVLSYCTSGWFLDLHFNKT